MARRHGPRLVNEYEKGGLECIIRVGVVAGYAATDAKHHRPMPADDLRERGRVALADELGQKFTVGALVAGSGDAAKPVNERGRPDRHRSGPPGVAHQYCLRGSNSL